VEPSPEAVLRGRYSAFSLSLEDYIMATTHQSHKDFDEDVDRWRAKVLDGLDQMRFTSLEIKAEASVDDPARLESIRGEIAMVAPDAVVEGAHRTWFEFGLTIPASGKTWGGGGKAESTLVSEISTFVKQDGKWYYSGGEVNPADGAWAE